jgi:pimeloyl-ACP methyl ester carboxylesterase
LKTGWPGLNLLGQRIFLSYRSDRAALTSVLDVFVDNFLKPGNLDGGFAHYKGTHAGRIAMMKGEVPELPQIEIPTCVRWAEHDPVLPYAWTDRLSETFAHLDLAQFPDVGHFPHREDPDRAAEEISSFFRRIGWS